jgi:hypothetical protein
MISCNIKWGIFISWNSNIIEKKEFDIEFFHDKGNLYYIVYVSNLSYDVDRLDLAIQLVRKLIVLNNEKEVSWIQTAIETELEQLNTVISKNYQLRMWFDELNTSICNSSNKFYIKMRDYMFEMEQIVKTIVERIKNTTSQAINTDINIYNLYLEKYHDNKKIFPVLSNLLDIFKEFNIIINETDTLTCNDVNIGNIKVMGKKITVYWDKYKHTSELGIDSNMESFSMIKLFANSFN